MFTQKSMRGNLAEGVLERMTQLAFFSFLPSFPRPPLPLSDQEGHIFFFFSDDSYVFLHRLLFFEGVWKEGLTV